MSLCIHWAGSLSGERSGERVGAGCLPRRAVLLLLVKFAEPQVSSIRLCRSCFIRKAVSSLFCLHCFCLCSNRRHLFVPPLPQLLHPHDSRLSVLLLLFALLLSLPQLLHTQGSRLSVLLSVLLLPTACLLALLLPVTVPISLLFLRKTGAPASSFFARHVESYSLLQVTEQTREVFLPAQQSQQKAF